MTKKVGWALFATMAIIIGLYPLFYLVFDQNFGFLSTKGQGLFSNTLWSFAFYTHIFSGGLALLIGWTQFSWKIRTKNPGIHRQTGKLYVIASLLSALTSVYIAYYATGGLIAALGFVSLGIIWFYTTLYAYLHIKKGRTIHHEKMMVFSYAACFAAVTLRIWLPLLVILFNDFFIAYKIVAWLCWVPNLLIAWVIVKIIDKREINGRTNNIDK